MPRFSSSDIARAAAVLERFEVTAAAAPAAPAAKRVSVVVVVIRGKEVEVVGEDDLELAVRVVVRRDVSADREVVQHLRADAGDAVAVLDYERRALERRRQDL